MIQRIQTLYLIIAVVLLIIIGIFPYAEVLVGNNIIYSFKTYGIYLTEQNNELVTSTYPLIVLISITILLIITSIFLFKKRLLQLRICLISIILMFGIYGLGFFYLYQLSSEYDTTMHFAFPIIIPIISAILIILAMRSIKKDELLIRSLDRLR